MAIGSGYLLQSFTGQDKNVDDAINKAERKANEWLTSTAAIQLTSVTSTVATNLNGKHMYVITVAYKTNE